MDIDCLADSAVNLRRAFGDRLLESEVLARHTSCRIGGPADLFLAVNSEDELEQAARSGWSMGLEVVVLGAGSNVLVSDQGVRGLVIRNQARSIEFSHQSDRLTVRAASGMSLPILARKCVMKGAAGLEWAVSVPGTVGGAIVGNAGAHGADIASSLVLADILQRQGPTRSWTADDLQLAYRSSRLKASRGEYVVLGAMFNLARERRSLIQSKVESCLTQRRRTQPTGASIGSMFKNPRGDYAGRLIEKIGMKGTRVGGARISATHANFFVNIGGATATDVYELISMVRAVTRDQSGVDLELEIELIGDWGDVTRKGITK